MAYIGNASDWDGQNFNAFAFDFDFHSKRAAHGHIERFGSAVYRGVRHAGVSERANIHDESWTVWSGELGKKGSCQLSGKSGVDVDRGVDLFCGIILQRLNLHIAADIIDEDGEIQMDEAGYEAVNLMIRSRGCIENDSSELEVLMLVLEQGFCSFELFGISAMQDDVEAVSGKLLGNTATDAITGSGYQSPGSVAVEIALDRGGSSVEVAETKESESCVRCCCDSQCEQ